MKLVQMLLIGVFAFGALLLTGCIDSPSDITRELFKTTDNSDKQMMDSPSDVTRKLIKAALNNDKKTMVKCFSPELAINVEKIIPRTKEDKDIYSKAKIVKEEINGDKATVTVSLMVGNTEEESKVYLEKINGKWIIVDFD